MILVLVETDARRRRHRGVARGADLRPRPAERRWRRARRRRRRRRGARRRVLDAAGGVRRPHRAPRRRRRRSRRTPAPRWAAAVLAVRDGRGRRSWSWPPARPRQRGARPRRRARGRGDGRQRAVVPRPVARSWSPARWSAARPWRRCSSRERPAVFTVAGHAVEPSPAATAGPGDGRRRSRPTIAEADLVGRAWSSSEQPEPDQSGALKSARVVVGAGRGAGSADGFDDLLELDRPARRLARASPAW